LHITQIEKNLFHGDFKSFKGFRLGHPVQLECPGFSEWERQIRQEN